MKKIILLIALLVSANSFCQENYDQCKKRLTNEAQEQLNQGIAPNNVILKNKSQSMAEADVIDEIRVQLKKIEAARAFKIKSIADAKQDSIAEATNPTLHEIREVAKAKIIKEELSKKEWIAKNAEKYYYDTYTPLDTLITRQLKLGVLPCEVKVTCYADFYSTQGDPSSVDEARMIDEKLAALCRGLKPEQDIPKYMFELEEYELKLLETQISNEQKLEEEIEEYKGNYIEGIEIINKLDSLYKQRTLVLSKAVNLRSRLVRDFKEREKLDISALILQAKKEDLKEKVNSNELSDEDYNGIAKMNWDEEKYFASKNVKPTKLTNQPITKYESIWSMYSEKKLNIMPKYHIEEAESFSILKWNSATSTMTTKTSSPYGEDETSIKIDSINKEGNKINYSGKDSSSKIIISINKLTKWIEITHLRDGKTTYEYHKIK
jgi:hypothetical protein